MLVLGLGDAVGTSSELMDLDRLSLLLLPSAAGAWLLWPGAGLLRGRMCTCRLWSICSCQCTGSRPSS